MSFAGLHIINKGIKKSGRSPNGSKGSKADSAAPKKQSLPFLMLASLGVVYGDLGTSPLYSLRQAFHGVGHIPVTTENVLGVLSLVFWALIIVPSTKYLMFVLRADNRGEGGIFALLALLRGGQRPKSRARGILILVGIVGAAVLYGDATITPAVTALSAVEGLEVATPAFSRYVVPLTIVILLALFLLQRRGTASVGAIFGPIMLLWFMALAALGLSNIIAAPQVLHALNPARAISFFEIHRWQGYFVLAAVFLALTGSEALYADLGHFGRLPIRLTWFSLILPALLINYFGQGAMLLSSPAGAAFHPFFHLAPSWALYPLVILAMAATVIASQGVISGAFSLTRQAIQLGFVPPLRVEQTAEEMHGQIYMPAVNWILMIAVIGLVLGFGSSSNLASAYGVAVNATMIVTTILAFNVARERGGWPLWLAGLFLFSFLTVDLAFFGANVMKVPDGGWYPLVLGLAICTLMTTWRRGGELLRAQFKTESQSVADFIGELKKNPIPRVPGTGIFLTDQLYDVPFSLRRHMRLNNALHEQVVLLTVVTKHVPRVPARERVKVQEFELGFHRVLFYYGFMQGVNVPSDLAACADCTFDTAKENVTYYVGRAVPIERRKKGGMMAWRDRLYAIMKRNSLRKTAYYRIPAARTVEIGLQVGI